MNSNELVLCGHVTKRTDLKRPVWMCFAAKLVELVVRSEDGYVGKYTMPTDHCFGIKQGQFVRIKRATRTNAYASEASLMYAFSAPTPRPYAIGRGYLLRIVRGVARVRLDDESVIEVHRCNMRGDLQVGDAVSYMAHNHGSLDQYRSRYIELDKTRPAWTSLVRDQIISDTHFCRGTVEVSK